MNNMILGIYMIATIFYNLIGNEMLFYVAFFLACLDCYAMKSESGSDYKLVKLCLYAIIIPSNYIILAVLIFVMLVKKTNNTCNHKCFVFLSCLYVVFNISVSDIRMTNIFFYAIYMAPVFLCMIYGDAIEIKENDKTRLVQFLKKTTLLQGFGMVTNLLFNYNSIINAIDFDWVVGTFGESQGNTFLFYCLFSFIIFLNQYREKRTDAYYMFISILYIVMTGSICLIFNFAFVIFIYLILNNKIEKRLKLKAVGMFAFLLLSFMFITPAWITNAIVRIAEADDKSIFISKLNDYDNVYFNPNISLDLEMIGFGVGNYSSRAALTCTGVYMPAYSSYFEPSISEYTNEYIYNKLVDVYAKNQGTLDTPFSQFISIKAELGYIGLFFLFLYFMIIFKDNKNNSRIYILFLFFSCFFENYLEFAKVITLLYICTKYFQEISDDDFRGPIRDYK